ncbi:MAG: hypothetical protein GY845_08465 [Planctomycetes bacterium]|nr:hypothetical protein [Planctomycetota bacterium]
MEDMTACTVTWYGEAAGTRISMGPDVKVSPAGAGNGVALGQGHNALAQVQLELCCALYCQRIGIFGR